MFEIPIIIFGSLKANIIFYGGIILIFLIWLVLYLFSQKSVTNERKTTSSNNNTQRNSERSNFKSETIVKDRGELINVLVTSYYQLEDNIKIKSDYITTASDVINILSNRKVFIFNNSFNCITSESDIFGRTSINVKVKYSQGFKIFRAILDYRLENRLGNQDLLVLNKIKKIFNNIIKPEMSDFKKVVAVHDYLILTSRYDYDNYKNGTIPDISYTPYGLLFNNKAVCSAYAEVFMIFMTLANIECYYVTGNIKKNDNNIFNRDSGHAWNIVKIENYYYHVDVTLDNPVPDIIGRINYKYLNVPDNVMEETHIWNKLHYPICNSMKHNYYNM